MSASPDELRDRVERMQREMKELQTAFGQLKARMASSEAQTYVERAQRNGDRAFVGEIVREADNEALRHLNGAIRRATARAASSLWPAGRRTRQPVGQRQRRSGQRRRAFRQPRQTRGAAGRRPWRRTGGDGAGRRKQSRRRRGCARRNTRRGARRETLAACVAAPLLLLGSTPAAAWIRKTCSRGTRAQCRRCARLPVVVFSYTVSQTGPNNIEQHHRLYRSGLDVRDETLSIDGIPLRRKLVRFEQRADRYAVARFAPSTGAYELLFLGTVKDGRHLDYTYEATPLTHGASAWIDRMTIDGTNFLPRSVHFHTQSDSGPSAAAKWNTAPSAPTGCRSSLPPARRINGKAGRRAHRLERLPVSHPVCRRSTFKAPQPLPHASAAADLSRSGCGRHTPPASSPS